MHAPTPYPPLISAAGLETLLGDPSLRLFDTTVHLGPRTGGGLLVESGRAAYEREHIPGAAFMDLLDELSDPDHALRFMLPSAERFAAAMSALGVGPGTRVVLYNSGPTWWSTRAFLMLREFGFDAAQVLDGGLDAWRAGARPLESGSRSYPAAQFTTGPRRRVFVGRDDVLAAVRSNEAHLVHALSADLFSGRVRTAARPGRIAGSVNLPALELLDPATQAFRPPAALRASLESRGLLDGRPVIAYCGGGISATTDAFALLLLGRDDAALVYDGSLNEWAADPALPMECDAPG